MNMPLARLGDVCEKVTDGTHQAPNWAPTGVPFLFVSNVRNQSISFETNKFVSNEEYQRLTRNSPIEAGDVLYTAVGSYGNAAVVPESSPFLFQRHIAHIKPRRNLVHPAYLSYALEHTTVRQQADRVANGVAQKTVTLASLKQFEIPLPPLDEQKRIAAILDKADQLRQKRKQAIALLDSLTQSIFLEMFGDPVSNPKGWPVGSLGDLIFQASDGPHVSPQYCENGIPFLSTRHITKGGVVWQDLKYISLEDAEVHWRKCRPTKGDILYTKGGTTGIAAAIDFDEPFAVWVHVALLKTNHDAVDPKWLECMLNSEYCYQQSQVYTHGIANRDLGLKRMVRIKLFIPPLHEQRDFSRRIGAVSRLAEVGHTQWRLIDLAFASLQHRAFSGQL